MSENKIPCIKHPVMGFVMMKYKVDEEDDIHDGGTVIHAEPIMFEPDFNSIMDIPVDDDTEILSVISAPPDTYMVMIHPDTDNMRYLGMVYPGCQTLDEILEQHFLKKKRLSWIEEEEEGYVDKFLYRDGIVR